ncbi:hypothetical protein MMC13_007191 [Lambiella insularis]|nr:hypothetical protein [Lambiella insularis]
MAAGTNRKRPWEEEADKRTVLAVQTVSDLQRPIARFPLQTPSGLDHVDALKSFEGTSSISQSRGTSLPYSIPDQESSSPSRDAVDDEMHKSRQLSLPNPIKRPRTTYSEGDIVTMNLPALELNSAQFLPQLSASAYDLNGARHYKPSLNPSNSLGSNDMPSIRDAARVVTQTPCQTCSVLRGVVLRAVKALEKLHVVLLEAQESGSQGHAEDLNPDSSGISISPPNSRIDPSLECVVDRLNRSIQMVTDAWTNWITIPPNLPEAMIYGERVRGIFGHDDHLKEGRLDTHSSKPFIQHLDNSPRHVNVPRALPLFEGGHGRSIAGEPALIHLPHSPLRTFPSTISQPMLPQSPIPGPPASRLVPSPSSINFSSSQFPPPLSPSFSGSRSPHTAHLRDLQNQLSTKSLAHQILQGQHDKLLAAYSRSQTRCATLDRKSQVSDTEITNLIEDRIRLQAQIDALDVQVDVLQQSRDEAHKQSVANGAQYMQIIGKSSRLQAQGAADMKKWKTDRDDWQRDKEALLFKIETLEIGGVKTEKTSCSSDSASLSVERLSHSRPIVGTSKVEFDSGVTVASTSVHALCDEVLSLRKRCHEMEVSLQNCRNDSIQLDEIVSKLGTISDRMRSHIERPQIGDVPVVTQ